MISALDSDETVLRLLLCENLAVGSRVGGIVQVPRQPRPDAPKLVFDDPKWALPAQVIARGEFVGNDWADDPAIGMWAEAGHPGQDAALLAEQAASGLGLVAILATHKRLTVSFPRKLLADQPKAPDEERGSLLGRAYDYVVSTKTGWDLEDPVHVQYSVPANRVTSMGSVMLGRSIPAPTFVRFAFTDDSLLFVREDPLDQGAVLAKELNRR